MLVELERHCEILLRLFCKPEILAFISSLLRPAMLKPIALFRGYKHLRDLLRDLQFNQELSFLWCSFVSQKFIALSDRKSLMLSVKTFWIWKSSSEGSGGYQ